MELSRRRLLQAMAAVPVVSLSGCSALLDGSPSPTPTPGYEHLRQTAVYTSDDVGLRIPDRIPRVEAPTNADLVVLHGNPTVDVEQVVSWLADDRTVALLGDRAQSTWVEWTQSTAYRETFEAGGRSEADPSPHLLVAAAAETTVSTHRYSWDNLPSNREIVEALEDAMADISTTTPR